MIRADVEAFLACRPQASPEPAPAAAPAGELRSARIPHTTTRRVIAEGLTASKSTIPHFYLSIDCDMDALVELRAQLNAGRPEPKLSINDFVIRATACALREVPRVNASWSDEYLVQHPAVDIAMAVATDSGLITPIIRDTDQKSPPAISTEIRNLAARARQGRLLPQEYQGGSFTVSNLGMYGVREFAAIINPPPACILAVGATERRPVVRADSLTVGWVMSCTLSADHRVVDGVIGAQFLATFRRLVEQPRVLVIYGATSAAPLGDIRWPGAAHAACWVFPTQFRHSEHVPRYRTSQICEARSARGLAFATA